jgi:hypothetical protein
MLDYSLLYCSSGLRDCPDPLYPSAAKLFFQGNGNQGGYGHEESRNRESEGCKG